MLICIVEENQACQNPFIYKCAIGTVVKLLQQLSLDLNIRVDEVKVQFPIKSKDYVSVLCECVVQKMILMFSTRQFIFAPSFF